MLADEISPSTLSRAPKGRTNFPNQALGPLDEDEVWNRRFIGILNGTLPPLTDEEIIEIADRRYEEIQSGKAEVLTLEEHMLATR